MAELCAGIPHEFKDFMDYCRSLSFEQEPEYDKCISFFDKCMQRHEFDPKVSDYTWKQNRLSKDKELLKSAMMNVIRKKPKEDKDKKKAEAAAAAGNDA